MNKEKTYTFKAEVKRMVYNSENFKVFGMNVLSSEGTPPKANSYGNVSICGDFEILDSGVEYTITATEETNKYGYSYKVQKLTRELPNDYSSTREFMLTIINKKKADTLLQVYPDILQRIIENKKVDLSKTKGIKEKTFKKIKDKVIQNFGLKELMIKYADKGITFKMLKKLYDHFTSIKRMETQLKNNPYEALTKIDNIGFKKADDIALKLGVERFSEKRLEAYIKYILDEAGKNGYSWIESHVLVDKIEEDIGDFDIDIINKVIQKLIKNRIIWNEEKGKVALYKYYKLELDIKNELLRIRDAENKFDFNGWEERVKIAELHQGFNFTSEQKEAIRNAIEKQAMVLTGGAGCVDCDTEYFNGTEWKKISRYTEGEKVLQFNKNKTANLAIPCQYHKIPEDNLYLMTNMSGTVNQVLSLEHNVVYMTSKNNLNTKPFREVMNIHNSNPTGWGGSILNGFEYVGGKGIDLTNEQIRVMIMVMADGHFPSNNNRCRVRVKKQRKIERIRKLLNDAKIHFYEKTYNGTHEKGYINFYFHAPIRTKIYPKKWYEATMEQLEVIYSEFLMWDGSIDKKGRRSWSTTIKNDADFIQFVCSGLGYTANIGTNDRTGEKSGKYIRKSVEYEVHISKRKWRYSRIKAKYSNKKQNIIKYTNHDGYKYCFTVPSGMLVLRRNNKIFITGNSGKSSTVLGAVKALGNVPFAQCALSGKAASRLEEITGQKASTIHRLLGFSPKNLEKNGSPFIYNEKNPLPYKVVILDEFSMIGGELFLNLLKSIPDGSKLIMIGDKNQLPAIGALNIANDLTETKSIHNEKLTKIHRQAQKSAVITESIKISQGQQIIKNNWIGEEKRGELNDLELDIYEGTENTKQKAIQHFKEKLKMSNNDIMEVQLIVPMNMRGNTSVYELNVEAQEIWNPRKNNNKEFVLPLTKDKKYYLRKNDKIINVKNNYKIPIVTKNSKGIWEKHIDEFSEEGDYIRIPIFNGYMGEIIEFTKYNELIIYFPLLKQTVAIDELHWKENKAIQLGYALTCHKVQGSGFKYPICILDSSHYVMLSKEWIYTAMTRSSYYCTIVAENKALRMAVGRTSVKDKQTFLKKLLEENQKENID